MFSVIPEFITKDEQQYIRKFVSTRIAELGGKVQTYSEHEQMFYAEANNSIGAFNRTNEPVLFFSIAADIGTDPILTKIARRMQDTAQVSYENPNTYFNWVISLSPSGTEVLCHLDPLDKKLRQDKKIVRMNVLVQNAKRGGTFDLLDADGEWTTADIPDRGLMIFDASEIQHKITKNLSDITRINFSIDAVVDK